MSVSAALAILLDGLAFGMALFIISAGLTITLGLMRVVNLAHGAFAMIGGYAGSVALTNGWSFPSALLIAATAAGAAGVACERFLFRPLYDRGDLPQALMTFGLTFAVIALLTIMFGTAIRVMPLPPALAGLVDIGFRTYPAYRLFLIAAGAALAIVLWLIIDRTLFGARLRAAVDNPRMCRAIGIDVDAIFAMTFAAGCALAGAGAVLGAELMPVEPYYALRYLVLFLIVVGIGGTGDFRGSFAASIALGLIDTAGKYFIPAASSYIFFATVIMLLLWRPRGLIPGPAQ
jgi:branched-chain amino acid transport system permease protein